MKTFLNIDSLLIFSIGFGIFILSMIGDWLGPTRVFRPWKEYAQDFLYTVISIVIGMTASIALALSPAFTYLISILMGFIGASLIRKFKEKKEVIADGIVDSVEHKIEDTIEHSTGLDSGSHMVNFTQINKHTDSVITKSTGPTQVDLINSDDKSA